ncbi:GNAT family N-acetyltransferase [Paenibacillus lutrae]|uniref:GNAT family N-acetyltransferase n=1 Tax=Paenibacillus lutrae TaxID=2078573 RepID=A0A7X3JXR3_9BACL|nr:GNAT family N-acetyltransferase [Paenibacillus lutrae]MVO98281.1 GNAT family N-acetyltransferase [Paenibacillus lutrae]
MLIRLLEKNDQIHVEEIMAGHPLQFPKFIIDKYPPRWNAFLTVQDYNLHGYHVTLANSCEVTGHAGYVFNDELGLHEIVGVAVSQHFQRQGIGNALIKQVCDKITELGNKQVILYTLGHAGNEATLSFYRNLGFEMVNFEKDFFEYGYHRITFLKSI